MNNYDRTLGYVRKIVNAVNSVKSTDGKRYLRPKPGADQAKIRNLLLQERESLQNEVRASSDLQPQVTTLAHSLILVELLLVSDAPVDFMAINNADPGNDKRYPNVFLDRAATSLIRLSGGLLEIVE